MPKGDRLPEQFFDGRLVVLRQEHQRLHMRLEIQGGLEVHFRQKPGEEIAHAPHRAVVTGRLNRPGGISLAKTASTDSLIFCLSCRLTRKYSFPSQKI